MMETPIQVLWYCLKQAQIETIMECKEMGNIERLKELIDKKLVNVIERHCGTKGLPGGGVILIWGKKGRFIFVTENTLRFTIDDEIEDYCNKEMAKDKKKVPHDAAGMYC